jgi:rubrerythrin
MMPGGIHDHRTDVHSKVRRILAVKDGAAHHCQPLTPGVARCGACGRGRIQVSQEVCPVCRAEIRHEFVEL